MQLGVLPLQCFARKQPLLLSCYQWLISYITH
jgi:hypothetical protein